MPNQPAPVHPPPTTYFTMDQIQAAFRELRNLKKNNGKFTLKDDVGMMQKGDISDSTAGERPILCYHSYQTQVRQYSQKPDYSTYWCFCSKVGLNCPIWIHPFGGDTGDHRGHSNNSEEQWTKWYQQWVICEIYQNIKQNISGQVLQQFPVNRILCVYLGCPIDSNTFKTNKTNCSQNVQYHIAWTVGYMIKQILGTQIDIYAIDQSYCDLGKQILQERLGITVVVDEKGWSIVDGQVFVIATGRNFPVREIVCDLLKDVGGPAGMFCLKIADTPFRLTRQYSHPKQGNRTTSAEANQSEPVGWKLDWHDKYGWTSETMLDLKKRCVEGSETKGGGFLRQHALYLRKKVNRATDGLYWNRGTFF